MAKTINGKVFDWADISVRLPHGEPMLIQEISYKDSLEVDPIYGKGGMAQGWGRGNHKGEGSMKVLREDFDKFVEWAAGQGRSILQTDPFAITVNYMDEDSVLVTDELRRCKIYGDIEAAPSQGSKSIEMTINFLILGGVSWNGHDGYAEPK